MIFQLLEVQALFGTIHVLMSVALVSGGLLALASVFFLLCRWTVPIHTVRCRVLKIMGYACLLPGVLIPTAVLVVWLVISLWPEPQIALAWDVARETFMEPFDPARCVHLERVQHCIYQGDITLSLWLPEGRTLTEKAVRVWVEAEGNRPLSITIYSVRYDVEHVYTKLEAYIAAWRLNRQIFEGWQRATRAGETTPLYYWWEDASPTTPRLWLMAKPLEAQSHTRWFLQWDLRWE